LVWGVGDVKSNKQTSASAFAHGKKRGKRHAERVRERQEWERNYQTTTTVTTTKEEKRAGRKRGVGFGRRVQFNAITRVHFTFYLTLLHFAVVSPLEFGVRVLRYDQWNTLSLPLPLKGIGAKTTHFSLGYHSAEEAALNFTATSLL
jgi:hypothetical protein